MTKTVNSHGRFSSGFELIRVFWSPYWPTVGLNEECLTQTIPLSTSHPVKPVFRRFSSLISLGPWKDGDLMPGTHQWELKESRALCVAFTQLPVYLYLSCKQSLPFCSLSLQGHRPLWPFWPFGERWRDLLPLWSSIIKNILCSTYTEHTGWGIASTLLNYHR